MDVRKKLEEANKLIFIRHYDKAAFLLDQALISGEGQTDLLLHIRRIELANRLNQLEARHDYYTSLIKNHQLPINIGELCVALIEQQAELVSPSATIKVLKEWMQKYGETAAAYFGIAFAFESQGNYESAIQAYRQSISADPNWYPAYFGLSQIFYNQNDEEAGDNYFFLFEKCAPYNLYGNFETHRTLSTEFLKKGLLIEAELAITSLSTWWHENQGDCPIELKTYESFALAQIAEASGNFKKKEGYEKEGVKLLNFALTSNQYNENVYFFLAKTLEEFSQTFLVHEVYKKIAKIAGSNEQLMQKIGHQYLSEQEYDKGLELFDLAYQHFPDSSVVRFNRLILNLAKQNIDIEDYLQTKEKLNKLIANEGDKIELLSLMHALLAKFSHDPDVLGQISDLYFTLGNIGKAEKSFHEMFLLDGKSVVSMLKYASFLMDIKKPTDAYKILTNIKEPTKLNHEPYNQYLYLMAAYSYYNHEYEQSLEHTEKLLQSDPWNVTFIALKIGCLTKKHFPELSDLTEMLDIQRTGGADINWNDFEQITRSLDHQNSAALVYERDKLYFLYHHEHANLLKLLASGAIFDSQVTYAQILKLLNTNFDSPWLIFGLGKLQKELWQFEVASSWFNLILNTSSSSTQIRACCYLELADIYVWQNEKLAKAVEYLKIAQDLDKSVSKQATIILSHAYIKIGEIRLAQEILQKFSADPNYEVQYLRGLIAYRNGSIQSAKSIWKPLLTIPSNNLRIHHFKTELLKYYFNGDSYLKVN